MYGYSYIPQVASEWPDSRVIGRRPPPVITLGVQHSAGRTQHETHVPRRIQLIGARRPRIGERRLGSSAFDFARCHLEEEMLGQ